MVTASEIDLVMNHYFQNQFPDAAIRSQFEAPREFFLPPERQRFLRLILSSVFVPDLSAYEVTDGEPKIDRRLPIDLLDLRVQVGRNRK